MLDVILYSSLLVAGLGWHDKVITHTTLCHTHTSRSALCYRIGKCFFSLLQPLLSCRAMVTFPLRVLSEGIICGDCLLLRKVQHTRKERVAHDAMVIILWYDGDLRRMLDFKD